MITILSRIFIKDYKNTSSSNVRQAYGILCGAVGILLNVLLFIGKFIAGSLSHSIAITADAFNNLSDAGSSIITLIGFKMAGQKPDPNHPFGHGRIEYISGLLVSIVILLMGFELIKTSISKIFHPEALLFSPIIIVILVLSIMMKAYIAFYNHTIGNKINSSAMKATATDSLSDTLSTSVVLISTLVSHYTSLQIDGYCGALVGIFICFAGINAAKETISPLLGQAPEPEFVDSIHNIVMSHKGVLGIHDLIVHNYGPGRIMISLHAEVPANCDISEMHDMIDLIEHEIGSTLQCSATIHMDPICIGDAETDELKCLVKNYLTEIDDSLSMHDFRIVKGPSHTNLIFDVVTPYHFHLSDAELICTITEKIQKEHPNYFTVIEVDKTYI